MSILEKKYCLNKVSIQQNSVVQLSKCLSKTFWWLIYFRRPLLRIKRKLNDFSNVNNFKSLNKEPTWFENPNNILCIDLLLTSRPSYFQNTSTMLNYLIREKKVEEKWLSFSHDQILTWFYLTWLGLFLPFLKPDEELFLTTFVTFKLKSILRKDIFVENIFTNLAC